MFIIIWDSFIEFYYLLYDFTPFLLNLRNTHVKTEESVAETVLMKIVNELPKLKFE